MTSKTGHEQAEDALITEQNQARHEEDEETILEQDDNNNKEEEEEVLVVLELEDFKNHPVFHDHEKCTLEGIDTDRPMLHIGEYTLYGRLEETVGTTFLFDTAKTQSSTADPATTATGGSSSTRQATATTIVKKPSSGLNYVGQTTKRIVFSIEPPSQLQ